MAANARSLKLYPRSRTDNLRTDNLRRLETIEINAKKNKCKLSVSIYITFFHFIYFRLFFCNVFVTIDVQHFSVVWERISKSECHQQLSRQFAYHQLPSDVGDASNAKFVSTDFLLSIPDS